MRWAQAQPADFDNVFRDRLCDGRTVPSLEVAAEALADTRRNQEGMIMSSSKPAPEHLRATAPLPPEAQLFFISMGHLLTRAVRG